MKPETRLIDMGRVVGAHGLRGGLKIATGPSGVSNPTILMALGQVEIGNKPYKVRKVRSNKRQILLYLAEINNRTQAETLVGLMIKADRNRFPPLPPGEFYWFEVLGLPVVDARDGTPLGNLADIIATPAHDVYVIRQGEQELLLPAVEEVISAIDVTQGCIKAIVPEGLI